MHLPPIETMVAGATAAAHAGGQRLLELRTAFAVREKAPSDFVTDADLASQEAVHQVLAEGFPNYAFLGEESQSDRPPADQVCWVVDPLDGTTNYVHQFPFFCVSVAAVLGNDVLVGVIFNPLTGDLYAAGKGQGARLNGGPISVSGAEGLAQALVSMSLPPKVVPGSPDLMDFERVVQECQAIRRTGSAALNLAMLASGHIDGYWARQINAWDVAAGVLLITEAGGVVTGSRGDPFNVWEADLAAGCNQRVHGELLEVLSR